MRIIPHKIPTIEELGLPPVFKKLADKPSGLVLITGPTGCGKTTTLAAVIDYINTHRKDHIIAVEDPIEYVHANQTSVVTQQELGKHVESFASALRGAFRGDPDVIVVGEMRDLETISNAITAAETGHLVFGTLHTNDAVQAIDRLIDVFPQNGQQQVRTQLAFVLTGVIYQTLLSKKDGSGRIPAFEVMVANQAIRNLIKENKSHQIYNIMQTSKEEGMQLLNTSLQDMVKDGIITKEEAMKKSLDPANLDKTINKSHHVSFQLTR
jgi:twitching motility protein PilT